MCFDGKTLKILGNIYRDIFQTIYDLNLSFPLFALKKKKSTVASAVEAKKQCKMFP